MTKAFNARKAEVQQLLKNGVLVFRRPLKLPPAEAVGGSIFLEANPAAITWFTKEQGQAEVRHQLLCPFGDVGKHLQVKEAWGYLGCATGGVNDRHQASILYLADAARREVMFPTAKALHAVIPKQKIQLPAAYADLDEFEQLSVRGHLLQAWWKRMRKQPASNMPHWASRFILEITAITAAECNNSKPVWVVSTKLFAARRPQDIHEGEGP